MKTNSSFTEIDDHADFILDCQWIVDRREGGRVRAGRYRGVERENERKKRERERVKMKERKEREREQI